jgi:hypothetical protein
MVEEGDVVIEEGDKGVIVVDLVECLMTFDVEILEIEVERGGGGR